MSQLPSINWPGFSGRTYTHEIHPINATFNDVPGNYLYAKQASPGHWLPVYIGQSIRLKDRLGNLEKEPCARRNGATHIHAHVNSQGEYARMAEERDLVAKWQPVCNDLLK